MDVAVNKIRIVVVDKASGVLPLGWFLTLRELPF